MKKNAFLFVSVAVLILLRYLMTRPNLPQGKRIRITEKISSEPVRYEKYQGFQMSGKRIYLPLYPELNYGDIVTVEGTVKDNTLDNPKLIKVKEGGVFYNLRSRLLNFYSHALPAPHSSLIEGIVVGSKSDISQDFWNKLKLTGTAHIVVASGMNVTLVASFLTNSLVIWLPRRKAIPLALIGIWVYSIFSGFDAPIVRAAVMTSLAFTAQIYGKVYDARRALILSAAGMLIIKPDWIMDLGFILSFVATASLVLFQKRISRYLINVPSLIREDLSTTLAAQVGVAPILYLSFGQLNILSPFINALVLWTVPPLTMVGMLAGILGLITPEVGKAVLYFIYPLSTWFVTTINIFS